MTPLGGAASSDCLATATGRWSRQRPKRDENRLAWSSRVRPQWSACHCQVATAP